MLSGNWSEKPGTAGSIVKRAVSTRCNEQVARVFVADGKADRRRRDAGLRSASVGKLRVGRQGRATDDRVRLAQADHVAERRRQIVEESLERLERDAGAVEVDREQRGRQAEEHQLLAQGGSSRRSARTLE